ncbi:MAG: family metallopeptidase [Daejeonella sp.]|nr:family metallopeptidase [Daejeonella sp.]
MQSPTLGARPHNSLINRFTLMTKYILFFGALFISLNAFAQRVVNYTISFPNAIHHEAEVSVTLPATNKDVLIRMSRSSPGRYATHEFGKNVYSVKAFNSQGQAIKIKQVEGDVYSIGKSNGVIKVTYTIFGNWVDGTYLGIDETHAHINMPATFMWVKGLEGLPIQITFNDLGKYHWKVGTQLKPTNKTAVFTAPNLQYFMDSPTELSDYKAAAWTDINLNKKEQKINLVMHSLDDQEVVTNFSKMIERTVQEAKMVFGELPTFDNGTYTFLHDVNFENDGDGMEHRNSTCITDDAEKIAGNEGVLIGTVSHEFFHSWNVERIRPKSLEPFKFDHANMSSELWLAEGFTQYYGELILKRAGYRTDEEYFKTLGTLLNSVLNAPGAHKYSPAKISRMAVFTDAGVSVDRNNYPNIFSSYYYYGAVTALALDLDLRANFNKTLDDYMRVLWKNHGKTEIPYTIPDLQNALASITNEGFAVNFFMKYIYGSEKNNYEVLLAQAGLLLQKAMPGKASLGTLKLVFEEDAVRVASNTIEGSPAYEAGLETGDYLLKIGDQDVKSVSDVNTFVSNYKPGDEVLLVYKHRGNLKNVKTTLKENTQLEVVEAGSLSPAQKLFRENWLSSKIK